MKSSSYHKTLTKLLAMMALIFTTQVYAEAPIYTGFFSNVAVSGYDTVAYFTEGKPVEGRSEYSTSYQDAEWRFSSKENLEMFIAAPDKYAPQYGGYCAWAVGNNKTAKGDPQQWMLHSGKLYLNYNADIQARWNKDKDALIAKADGYWPSLID